LLDHLDQVFAAETIEAIWALHIARMARYGFDRLIYAVTRFHSSAGLGTPSDQLVLTNHHPDYVKALMDGGLFEHSPMVQWTLVHEGARSWARVAEDARAGRLGAASLQVLDLNRKYGVVAGVSISFRSSFVRARAGIGLCAAPGISQPEVDAIWARNRRDIMLANQCMHLRISTMPFGSAAAPLTRRQRQVLEAVGEGKSVADIAALLGVSRATAEKHLRLARAALGVETTAQAVLKASLSHQIYSRVH